MKNSAIYYSVGALLYCPANRESIVKSIIAEEFGNQFSLSLCLEDTISDACVSEAEETLLKSLRAIYEAHKVQDFYLPHIFIRVRCPEQIQTLTARLGDAVEILSGYIAPKFSLENADAYLTSIKNINVQYPKSKNIYLMPIFESPTIINLQNRYPILYELKHKLDSIEELILNIRVGGNDLCHMFGLRRHINKSIHDIRPIDHILSDILTVFGTDYVVSGPVWEYYNGSGWETGLKNEISQDLLCGFVGKTVIHPNQIKIVNDALRVPSYDLEDAKSILDWDNTSDKLVSGSVAKERMNEYKTHSNWALKTILMAECYGTQ